MIFITPKTWNIIILSCVTCARACILIWYISIAILFENSLKKDTRQLFFNLNIEGVAPTLSILCYNIQANAIKQSHSITVVKLWCIITWCGKPDVMQETWTWPLMEIVLRSNGHHKEGSKLKLSENSTCMYECNIVKSFFLHEILSISAKGAMLYSCR